MLLLLASAVVGPAGEALANEPAADGALEEVVVSARKRGAESLQDIGGSIQAIDGSALADKVATGMKDFMRSVPNLGYNMSGSGQAQLTMRGINTTRLNRFNANVPSTVAVYFDEIPITTSGYEPDAGPIDLERIEVLRGPQGTLFGASAMSGMIRLVPRSPDFEAFAAEGGVSASSTKSGAPSYAGHMMVNIPVTEDFAARIVGFSNSSGGYIDNVYRFQSDEDYNDSNSYGARVTGLWNASESLAVKATLSYQKTRADGRPDEFVPNDPAAGIGLVTGINFLLPSEQLSQFQVADELQTSKLVRDIFDDELWFVALQGDWELSESTQLTSVTSYSQRDIFELLDDSARFRDIFLSVGSSCAIGTGACLGAEFEVPVVGVENLNNTSMDRFAQDLRAKVQFAENITGVVGLYYEDETRFFQSDLPVPGIDAWHVAYGNLGGFVPVSLADSAIGVDNAFYGIFDINTKQFAAYGEVSLDIGRFTLNGGLRYFDYKQDTLLYWTGWAEFSDDRVDESISENGFNPKVELLYDVTDDVLLYASAAKGFRLGAVAQVLNLAFCQGDLDSLGIDDVPTTVKSDSLWNYEAGIKATLFGGSTRVRASAFHIDWKDARNAVNLPCGWIAEFSDLQIVSDGVELEIENRLSDELSWYAGLGYNQAELDEDAPSINAVKGDETPYSPDWTANIGFDYVRPAAIGDLSWILRADASYVGEQFTELGVGVLPRYTIPDSTTFNLYTGFAADRWHLTFFVKNLTDERVVTGGTIDRRQPLQYSRARPREFGISLQFSL